MNVVFLGDSVTAGSFGFLTLPNGELGGEEDLEACYVHQTGLRLQQAFADKSITAVNAGVGGDNAQQALARFERDVLPHRPAVTVVCLGLNHVGLTDLTLFTDPLKEIFTKLNCIGSKTVFLTPNMLNTRVAPEVPPAFAEYAAACAKHQNGGGMDALVQAGIDAAKDCGAVVCDAYAEWKKLERYGIDTTGLLANFINHPTKKMHLLFTDKLTPVLTALCQEALQNE